MRAGRVPIQSDPAEGMSPEPELTADRHPPLLHLLPLRLLGIPNCLRRGRDSDLLWRRNATLVTQKQIAILTTILLWLQMAALAPNMSTYSVRTNAVQTSRRGIHEKKK